MLSIINIYSVFLSLFLFVSDSGKLADMKKKIKTVILLVMIAMVTALLVHSYSHTMIPQHLVSNMRPSIWVSLGLRALWIYGVNIIPA